MLRDQVVLITGCSTGIGRALAVAFHQRGHRVIATARRPDRIAGLEQDRLMTLRLDVTDDASMQSAVDAALARHGRIDVLVNNAGFGQMGPMLDISREQLREQFETNVVGVVALSRMVAAPMIKEQHGRIVTIGSVSGILTTPFAGPYCASKAAVHAVCEALRMELAPFGVDVIIVQPGGVESHMGENAATHLPMNPDSMYKKIEAGIVARAKASQRGAMAAETVAGQIVEAVTRDKAPAIVRVGTGRWYYPALKRVMPTASLDRMLARRFGLDRL
jgi:NAD(P)-dependent dehydrogenase (short-subunit alcohol dehydrogenase family)